MNAWLESFKKDLERIICISSIYKPRNDEFPFGKDISSVLDETLMIFQEHGYLTVRGEKGYYGYAEIGEGKDINLGVLCHLDVVPAGDLSEWDTDPFQLVEKESALYARGVQDDKGPTILALYALEAVKNSIDLKNKRIRFIFGTDEETLWRGIQQYTNKEEIPLFSIVPDASFPLIFAEKGLLQLQAKSDISANFVVKGGDAFNAVASWATYQGNDIKIIEQHLAQQNVNFEIQDNIIKVFGISAHAQRPQTGKNAIYYLLKALYDSDIRTPAINFIVEDIDFTSHGENIFGHVEDESGLLTMNLGRISIDQAGEVLDLDVRIPVTIEKSTIVNQLMKQLENKGLNYEEHDFLNSIYLAQDTPFIQSLMQAYQKVTGDYNSKPLASGGATYARALPNAVAFGIVPVGSTSTEHKPNEHLLLKDIQLAYDIYKEAYLLLLK